MTDYFRLRTWVQYSENSDYHDALQDELEYTSTPTVGDTARKVSALTSGGGGTSLNLGHYTSVTAVVVENLDATNYVEIEHDYDGQAAVTYLPAGAHTILYSPTPASDMSLTADTAAVTCKVWVIGTPAT